MRLLLLLICCTLCSRSTAQNSDSLREALERVKTKAIIAHADPPKFDTELDRFNLLANRSIRMELGIGIKKWIEIQDIRKKSAAELSSLSDLYVRTSPRPFDLALLEVALKEQEAESIRKTLRADQLVRLGQLVHYVEIAYDGLPKALAFGNLAREVGVHENQVSQITRKGSEIVKESERSISQIRLTTFHKILALLPRDSQDKAVVVLGPYFEIGDWPYATRDYLKTQSEELAYTGKEAIISQGEQSSQIHPTAFQLLIFLGHSELWRELGFTSEQVARLNDAITRSQEGVDTFELLDEFLLPHQIERAQQLYYYQELKQTGYATAMTVGNVGKALGVPSQFAEVLGPQIQEIENTCDLQCRVVQQKAHEQVLRLLSSEQRRRAEELLGPYFCYVDGSIANRRDGRDLYLRSKVISK